VFNRIIGDYQLERDFAVFLEKCPDVVSFSKNYFAVGFKLDYVTADGDISNYYPDFIVKTTDGRVIIAETKGREDLDVAPKMHRLRQWCEDVNSVQGDTVYDCVYVDEESFRTYQPKTFQQLLDGFKKNRRDSDERQN
jgi:type III restriction enzyme